MRVFLVAGAALLLALLWGGIAWQIVFDKARTTYQASLNVANESQLVDEHLVRVVSGIDQALLSARREYEKNPTRLTVNTLREGGLDQSGWLAGLVVIDGEGQAVAGSAAHDGGTRLDPATRHAFDALRQSRDDRLFIGMPVRTAAATGGNWEIPLAHRLRGPDGSFAGMVALRVDASALSVVFNNVNIGQQGFVAVVGRDDLGIRTLTSAVGATVPSHDDLRASPLRNALTAATAGAFLDTSPVDGTPQIVGYRALRDYPLIVTIGASKAEILGPYRTRRNWLVLAGGALSFAVFAGAALLLRQDARRRRTEAALLQHADELAAGRKEAELAHVAAQTADRAKSAFLANMSHELRTPLNAIIGFSETMSAAVFGPLSGKYHEYSQIIHTAGSDLLKIINDILDLSKIESGRFELYDEEMTIEPLFDGCRQLISGRAAEAGLLIEFDAGGLALRADPLRLKQMLLNLVSNAIKFTPPGGRITTSAHLTELRCVAICVRDTGTGIKEADFARVLEPFGQVDNPAMRGKEGTGLGLPLVRRLVELHGGELVLESRPGEGTAATLIFPPEHTLSIAAVREALPWRDGLKVAGAAV